MNKYHQTKLKAVQTAYELLMKWCAMLHEQKIQPPFYIVVQVQDVPAIRSTIAQGREVVTMSGLDLWENGNLKKWGVSEAEALSWLISDESACAQPARQ